MAKSDPMLARIRAFDRARGGGVAVERANKGYSLFSVATGFHVAVSYTTASPYVPTAARLPSELYASAVTAASGRTTERVRSRPYM